MPNVLENIKQNIKLYILLGSVLGATVTILTSLGYFKGKIDSYAKEIIKENFYKEELLYRNKVKSVIGSEPIERFVYNSQWVDSLRVIYPALKTKYKVMGMYVDPISKHRFYIDKDGIEFKVFKDPNNNYYYFDSNINFINP